MKGFISVEFPTKQYIKAYLINKLGEQPIFNTNNIFGRKLADLLEHKTNERKSEFQSSRYKTTIRVYITKHLFKQRGANLNETNVKEFNLFVEGIIKHRFHELMDDYIEILPSFEANLPAVRKKLGIDIEAWSDDSMKKEYYRYRKENNKHLLYNKTFTRYVPSELASNFTW